MMHPVSSPGGPGNPTRNGEQGSAVRRGFEGADNEGNPSPVSVSSEVERDTSHTRLDIAGIPVLPKSARRQLTLKDRVMLMMGWQKMFQPRDIRFREEVEWFDYPPNVIRNQKFTILTFLPVVLFQQFKFFFNAYFLMVALSQLFPPVRIGFLFTYIAPLAFVVSITMSKEAYDDYQRHKRDKDINGQEYKRLTPDGLKSLPSADIRVGMFLVLDKNERVPADMVLLRTTEKQGASFIRTDQLDGETDWKLRYAAKPTQELQSDEDLLTFDATLSAAAPIKDIYEFVGTLRYTGVDGREATFPLDVENTMWANTVVASGTCIGVVVYTGKESRSTMNTSHPRTKVGLLEYEINHMSKLLFVLMVSLAFAMVALRGFTGNWGIVMFRFVLLFSSIIPMSMRVNLDMAKTIYSYWIMNDKHIPGTVVRTSTIPEELGRIEYLLSDKTGTLTQNEMVFNKLHVGTAMFSVDELDELRRELRTAFEHDDEAARAGAGASGAASDSAVASGSLIDLDSPGTEEARQPAPVQPPVTGGLRQGVAMHTKVQNAIRAIALCHNVTPVFDGPGNEVTYQAWSPDEVALVEFAERVELTLADRTTTEITLRTPTGGSERYTVLALFPFTSERKRMGIILRSQATNQITLYMKGADTVMAKIVSFSDWLEEECGNMARQGLRTLVFARKQLSEQEFTSFQQEYDRAKASLENRNELVDAAQETLESDMELLALSGVEDKLQDGVKNTLETLRNAGVKVWMLTGDKVETATNIAISAKLVGRNTRLFTIKDVKSQRDASAMLNQFAKNDGAALIIDGASLALCLQHYPQTFIKVASASPSVVCCRCSPTQKAEVVRLIRQYTGAQTCAIGDGGNDVSMIQAAHVGLGIVGKEGKQASLAADFSITQFSFITRLMLWHGRLSYLRSASISQFVIHRGVIISIMQAIFSSIFFFAAIAIYTGWLLVGYTTIFTMFPVFALVLDEDVNESIALMYPELYRQLQKGRALCNKTFFIWVLQSVYQAAVIIIMAIFLFEKEFVRIISITFTSLILVELINIAAEVHTWHRVMVYSEIGTVIVYFMSMIFLPGYFDLAFVSSVQFLWKTVIITLFATVPLILAKYLRKTYAPAAETKLRTS